MHKSQVAVVRCGDVSGAPFLGLVIRVVELLNHSTSSPLERCIKHHKVDRMNIGAKVEALPKDGITAVLSKSESSENKISSSNDGKLSIGDRVEAKFR